MNVSVDYYLVSAARAAHRLLHGYTYTMGREAGVEIPLQDVLVSRRHAQIVFDGEEWVLVDMGSRNGIFVNGSRVQGQQVLVDQDRIQVGGQVFSFMLVPAGSDVGQLGIQAPMVESEITLSPGMNLADMASQGAAFSGQVGPGGTFELLQFLAQTRKSGRFDLLNANGLLVGTLWVSNGAVREAMYKMSTGFDALVAMMAEPIQRFAFHADDDPPEEPSITGSAEGVLMELARLLDERGR